MPRQKRQAAGAESDSEDPEWDTTLLTMRKWLLALPEYCESLNEDYVTWWEQGFVMVKHQVACPTASHPVALRDTAVRSHSFQEPISAEIFSNVRVIIIF